MLPISASAIEASETAAALLEAHRLLSNVNADGSLNELCDRIGRLAREALEAVRLDAEQSRR